MTEIVAVHCGAGNHSSKYFNKYNKLSKKACQQGMQILKKGGSALEAVTAAITVLEDDPLTNSGYGSNLTMDGLVEGDASVMDGSTLMYGGCGAVQHVKNPIQLAYQLCLKQNEAMPLGLIPPSLLVGNGGFKYAKSIGLKTLKQSKLISSKAMTQYNKYKKLLESPDLSKQLLDTVGAVCVDSRGNVAAGCSSGGILLKRPGRVGQAAIYACGVWADSFNPEAAPSVAACTSGCGEYLVRTQLAKQIAEDVKMSSFPTVGLSQSITEKFLKSRHLLNVDQKLCGALIVHLDNKTKDINLLWGHTTESMSIGYMGSNDANPKALISELPREIAIGRTVNVSGVHLYSDKT